jgi:DNA-binding transcriptional ArsR family regulator
MSKLDLNLSRALSNPLRVRIVCALEEGKAAPRDLASDLGEDLVRISYHLAILVRARCIRVAVTRRHRGAVEQIYELTPVAASGHVTRRHVPAGIRGHASAPILQELMDRGVAALEAGTLDRDEKSRLSCMPLELDAQGWKQVMEIMDETLERVSAVHEASAHRLRGIERAAIAGTIGVASFELPEEALDR